MQFLHTINRGKEVYLLKKECIICGTEFTAKQKTRKYCDVCQQNSGRARKKAENNLRKNVANAGDYGYEIPYVSPCAWCDTEYVSHDGVPPYCSQKCVDEAKALGKIERCAVCGVKLSDDDTTIDRCNKCTEELVARTPIKELATPRTACRHCGKQFTDPKSTRVFCDNECRRQWQAKQPKTYSIICFVCGETCEVDKNAPRQICHNPKCYETVNMVEANCAVCGKPFMHHRNIKQNICSPKCRKTKNAEAAKETNEKKKESSTAKRVRALALNEQKVKDALDGRLSDKEAEELHLCTDCSTSMSLCIKFTSNYVYHPKGAQVKLIGGKSIVLICPEYCR